MTAILFCIDGTASATDLSPPPPPAPVLNAAIVFAPPTLYHPDRFELRGGVFAHAVGSHEAGSVDVNLELVAPRFFTIPVLPDFFTPRFHVGGMINLDGQTSYAYVGALWTINLSQNWFAEGFFGGIVHNGKHNDITGQMNDLGCSWAFHSGGSLGYRLNARWTVLGTFDHLSNATLCQYNKGINDWGLRLGYTL